MKKKKKKKEVWQTLFGSDVTHFTADSCLTSCLLALYLVLSVRDTCGIGRLWEWHAETSAASAKQSTIGFI